LTPAERAVLDAYDEATQGRVEPPARGDPETVDASSNVLATCLQLLVPRGFVLVHEYADEHGDFTEAVFDHERVRVVGALYRDRIIDADHTLQVASQQPGADVQATVLDDVGRYVITQERSGFLRHIAFRNGDLFVVSIDRPLRQEVALPFDRDAFQEWLERTAVAFDR
jgi:hypothetical protein